MLGFLNVWSSGGETRVAAVSIADKAPEAVTIDIGGTKDNDQTSGERETNEDIINPPGIDGRQLQVGVSSGSSEQSSLPATPGDERPPSTRRLSLQSVTSFYSRKSHIEKAHTLSHDKDLKERAKATEAAKYAATSFSFFSRSSKASNRHVEQSALAVQKLIVGPGSTTSAISKVPPVTTVQLTKIKSELMRPKSANRLIAKLRELPISEENTRDHCLDGTGSVADTPTPKSLKKSRGPIHAVCLKETDAEMEKYFSKLTTSETAVGLLDKIPSIPSVATATMSSLIPLFEEMHIVNLLTAPDFGLGQPGDGEGILAGAIPTAETIIEGVTKITPQLMALGYATGKAITPDHTDVYPPLDRISVLTYWWGLEVCLPEPTLQYLDKADSISHAVINLLTALSVMNEGVREILPFVRYISQFMDFEFNAIKAQDRGKGVVCSATWIMPAAMVPRSWDFPDKPSTSPPINPGDKKPSDAPRTGKGVVEDIRVPPMMLPSLVVTPPSVIRSSTSAVTAASIA